MYFVAHFDFNFYSNKTFVTRAQDPGTLIPHDIKVLLNL